MNIKVLTKAERKYLNDRYTFILSDNHVHVKVNEYSRITVHSLNESINITSKVRRMTLSSQAIHIWAKKYVGQYSLIDVQNAINYLKVSYQTITDETIDNALNSINKRDAERYV